MNKLLSVAALAAALFSTSAAYAELKDYSDRSLYTCDKDAIAEAIETLWSDGAAKNLGISLLYVKGEPVETSRKPNELRCRVVLVTSKFTSNGVFFWVNQDGHALYGYAPNKTK